jgi:malate dehydrogenase
MRIAQNESAQVVIIDTIEGLPQGLALDMNESAPIEGFEPNVMGTNDYADTAGSDIIVITAGFPRRPGMRRVDLLGKNAGIVRDVVEKSVPGSPDSIIIVVTNPVGAMTFLASEVSRFPKQRVIGMAGVLDSARLRYFLGKEFGVSPSVVEAMTLGSHGKSMVPLARHAKVNGKPLTELVDDSTLERLLARARDAGAEIVALLKKGSAFYAPSAAVTRMVEAIVHKTGELLPVCAWCAGQYGIDGTYVGVPVRLSRSGVDEIVELDLSEGELSALCAAADAIRADCADLSSLSS